MISILYPIRNRLDLFRNTIDSIKKYAHEIKDEYEIIVLDSAGDSNLRTFCRVTCQELPIRYVHYDYPNLPERHNPAYAFNLGFRLAKYDSIVLTSPEISHRTPVVKQLMKLVGKNVICRVIDLKPDHTTNITLVSTTYRANSPGLYFIGMYTKNFYKKLGGIDEQFMKGESCEDVDFGNRFLRANLTFEIHDEIVGLHQWHPRVKRNDKTFGVNYAIMKNNDKNKVIVANQDRIIGNPQYIKEIV